MPYSTAWLGDIDRDPRTENCDDQGQGSQWKSSFRPFNWQEKTDYGECRQKIESTDCLFGAIHVLIERVSARVIGHATDRLVRPLSGYKDWIGRRSGNQREDQCRDLC